MFSTEDDSVPNIVCMWGFRAVPHSAGKESSESISSDELEVMAENAAGQACAGAEGIASRARFDANLLSFRTPAASASLNRRTPHLFLAATRRGCMQKRHPVCLEFSYVFAKIIRCLIDESTSTCATQTEKHASCMLARMRCNVGSLEAASQTYSGLQAMCIGCAEQVRVRGET